MLVLLHDCRCTQFAWCLIVYGDVLTGQPWGQVRRYPRETRSDHGCILGTKSCARLWTTVKKSRCKSWQALREWADAHFSTEVSYERALSLIVSKGYPKEVQCLHNVSSIFSNTRQIQVLDACLEEYSSLDVLVLDGDNNIFFVEWHTNEIYSGLINYFIYLFHILAIYDTLVSYYLYSFVIISFVSFCTN